MATILHKSVPAADMHAVHAWTWADAAARAAQSVVAADVGKIGRQSDTGIFYILVNHSPATWSQVSDTLLSPVRAICAVSSAQSFGGANIQINFDTVYTDTDNAVTKAAAGSSGTWKFTCPAGKGGTYLVCGAFTMNGAQTVYLWKNGVSQKAIATASISGYSVGFSLLVELVPGDYIDLRNTGPISTVAGVAINHVEIFRLSP